MENDKLKKAYKAVKMLKAFIDKHSGDRESAPAITAMGEGVAVPGRCRGRQAWSRRDDTSLKLKN